MTHIQLLEHTACPRRSSGAWPRAELTLRQFNVLMELAATPDAALRLYELNARLVATPPNTSWITTRMQKAGLVPSVETVATPGVVILALSEAGWAASSAPCRSSWKPSNG